MKWFSHALMGLAVSAPFGGAPAAILGATAPDWLEHLGGFRHREETHVLLYWLVLLLIGVGLYFVSPGAGFQVFWFALGGVVHWLGDALTVSGVPLTPWSTCRVTLLGGRLRTGELPEYLLAGVLLVASFLWLGWRAPAFEAPTRFSCLLVRAHWCQAGQKKIEIGGEKLPLASPAEVRQHRFEW